MRTGKRELVGFVVLTILVIVSPVFAQGKPDLGEIYKEAKERKGKRPIIIIPGILGSELKNKDTGEKVWFSFSRSNDEDLDLPIALNLRLSKDNLVPGDILREVDLRILPNVKIYQGLIETLTKYGGYEEASWDQPPVSLEDKFFVFPYDWRRDNVETAQYLLEKITDLRTKTKNPDVKFNVLAHSMGGLIARYAAMYGMADLNDGPPKPTWEGEKYFAKIFFFGTPNEGSAEALHALMKGKSALGGSVKIPFVRFLTPVVIATMPSVFQLLPHSQSARFYDEDLNPIKIDLYDIANWRKYGWAIYSDDNSLDRFTEAETGRLEQYLELVLTRAKRFHEALNAYTAKRVSVGMFLIGSDCSATLDAMVIYKDAKTDRWETLTKASSFRNSKGVKITSDQLKSILYSPGDGNVTRRSLMAGTIGANRKNSILFDSALPLTSALFICEDHEKITNNPTIQNNVLTALVSEASQ